MPVPVPRRPSPPLENMKRQQPKAVLVLNNLPEFNHSVQSFGTPLSGKPVYLPNGRSDENNAQYSSPAKPHRRRASKPTANGHSPAIPSSDTDDSTQYRQFSLDSTPTSKPAAPQKIDWEIPRKVLHSSIGFGVLYLYSTRPDSLRPIITILSADLAIIASFDFLRLNNHQFEQVYEKAVGFLMRESEKSSTNGVIWYLIGVIYVLALLPRDIAVASILILSWCDTAASTIGRKWGHLTPRLPRHLPLVPLPLAPKKSLAGFMGAAITGAVVAISFWGWAVPHWQGYELNERWGPVAWQWGQGAAGGWIGLLTVGLVTGLIAAVSEALDLGNIDDNLSLPVISGTILFGLSKLVSYLFG